MGLLVAKNAGPDEVELVDARFETSSTQLERLGFGIMRVNENDTVLVGTCGSFPPKNWNAEWLRGARIQAGEAFSIVPVVRVNGEGTFRASRVVLTFASGGRERRTVLEFEVNVRSDAKTMQCPVDPLDHRRSGTTPS